MAFQPPTRRIHHWKCWVVFACLTGSFQAAGASHPSFAGSWKMDATRSDFGILPKVSEIADQITEQPAALVIHRSRDGEQLIITIPIDGPAKDNDILGIAMKTEGHWEGNVLVVDFAGTRRGKPVTYKERWTMSEGGGEFRVARHLVSPRGETDQTLVMVKQTANP